jgi:beta-mannanase
MRDFGRFQGWDKAVARPEAPRQSFTAQQLANACVHVLWRTLHEIDSGWFSWTDGKHPENTAALWRMMLDYFVKERKLSNLIRVGETYVN